MPTARSRFSHRHLLALGTFLVPLLILAALGWSELERSGDLLQAAQQREGREFLARARQAIEQQLDSYLTPLLDQSREQLEKLEPVRATLAIADQPQFAALHGIVLLDEQGNVVEPRIPLYTINLPLASDVDLEFDSPLVDGVRAADYLMQHGELQPAIRLLRHLLVQLAEANPPDASPRERRPSLELIERHAHFRLATALRKAGAVEEAKAEFGQVKRLALQRGRDLGLLADLALAELGTPADRLVLLHSIAENKLDTLTDGMLKAIALRLAGTFPADDPARTEVDRLVREAFQLAAIRTFTGDYDVAIRYFVRQRRGRHTEADGTVQRVVATIDEQPVLVCVRPALPEEARKWSRWNCTNVGLHLDLRAILGATWQKFGGGDSAFVLAVREDESALVAPPPAIPADWVPPTVETEGLTLLAYPADPGKLAADAASAASKRLLLILILSITALGGALWSWRSVSREGELAALKIDLVSRVSHELKTPLALVRMYGETLGMGRARDPNQAAEFGGIIAREAGRLTTLINRILDFSRQQAGTLSYAPATIDLGELLRRVVGAYTPHLEARGVILIDSLPLGILAACDANAAESAIVNLLENAAKYGRDEDAEHEVELVLEQRAGFAIVEVRDRGRGIPPGESARVFEGFYRASNAGEVRGAGLGLSLVRHFARAHGGDIEALPRDGGGIVMRLTLPLAAAAGENSGAVTDTLADAGTGPAPTP